jgi:sugar transferase (PEP-CTERM/EpsH1 system associated)
MQGSRMENNEKKTPLLFLCHRIPFPPNKGDKIRSFNMLKKFSEKYEIHLGCFIDDPFDQQFVVNVAQYCSSVFALKQDKLLAKVNALKGLLTGQAITLPYYFSRKMQRWVGQIIMQYDIDKVFIYSSSMAQYCEQHDFDKLARIIDFVDVDSDKWRQYADNKTGLARWIFNREHKKLAAYENKISRQFDHSLFVSGDEAALFRACQPSIAAHKIHGVFNGVDIDFFDPQAQFLSEALVPSRPFICFTGAMDYWANVDGVLWFIGHVWPLLLALNSDAIFCIVGGNPGREVKALAKQKGIIVTGRVSDVRPFISQARCVVAPLRVARGIQNKILEAMSLNKSVVVTSMAMAGINAQISSSVHVIDDAKEYAQCLAAYLCASKVNTSNNRQWIIDHFTWSQTLQPLNQFFSPHKSEV